MSVASRLARRADIAVRGLGERANILLDRDREYEIAPGVVIALPAGHKLPAYQAAHSDYDRFLPHLAAALPVGSTIVDVGANCGDTLAAMSAANPGLAFVCIEPDPLFDVYLRRNLERLRGASAGLQVRIVNAMVGLAVSGAALAGTGGTKKQVVGGAGAGHATVTLDALLADSDRIALRLIKSDVDGFDWDVLDSASATIDAAKPLLFFECQLDEAFQKTGYERAIAGLMARGYSDWTVFDNFGAVMLTHAGHGQIGTLLDYLWRQNSAATRTVYYFDLLAATSADAGLIAGVVAGYGD